LAGSSHLDVAEQLQEVFGGHDDGGVERDDVALVQTQIKVGGQPLKQKTNIPTTTVALQYTP